MSLLSWLSKSKTAPTSTDPAMQIGSQTLESSSSLFNEGRQSSAANAHQVQLLADPPSSDASQAATPLYPLCANQPSLSFPKRTYGKQQRAFCLAWYTKHKWLHYQEGSDSVLCYYCMVAEKRGLLVSGNRDDVFSKIGYSNWKKALQSFEKHENTIFHREAVQMLVTIPQTTRDVGDMLSDSHAAAKAENRKMLEVIISSIRFLGRQGLALRGHQKKQVADSGEVTDGEIDSNFIQLLRLRAGDNEGLNRWLMKSQDKFTSPECQNEILGIMALSILRDIYNEMSGRWFSLMVDECTDASNTQQAVFCFRYVDDNLDVQEEAIGMHNLDSTDAKYLFKVVKDILLRFNLSINNCRGQCFDGASNMAGTWSGVCTRFTTLEPRALFTHCYGHSLNLATQDTLKTIKIMEDCMDTVYEITKLIKKSPKRDVIFNSIKTTGA